MSSREIAEVVKKRHDSVKHTIESLTEQSRLHNLWKRRSSIPVAGSSGPPNTESTSATAM